MRELMALGLTAFTLCDILPYDVGLSTTELVEGFVVIVSASSTTAFTSEGLTLCPQALSSAQSVPTFKMFNDALRSL